MNEEEATVTEVNQVAASEPPKPKKASARKLLQRELQARYRIYTPVKWAAEKAREAQLAEKVEDRAAREAADLADLES